MEDIEILGNLEKGKSFLDRIKKKDFLFSFVISYTETCEIPGITIAGTDPDSVKYTPAADAEYLHYGFCKCIDKIPMTPDGKPSPALLTKVALESASIPHLIKKSGTVVAINNSARSPIFKASDIGILGDFEEVVPVLTKALVNRR